MAINTQKWPAFGAIVGLVAAAGLFLFLAGIDLSGADRAHADQDPADCLSNALSLEFAQLPGTVHQGDTIEYRVLARNNTGDTPGACNITGADITFVEPAADGTPTGNAHSLDTGVDLPADGSGDLCFRSSTAPPLLACPAGTTLSINEDLSYVVNVNAGVSAAAAGSSITGDRAPTLPFCPNGAASLHDSQPNSEACDAKTLSNNVTVVEETATPTPPPETQTPSPTPTALAQALPPSGGAPGESFDMRAALLIILAAVGVGFALAGPAAMMASRRRIE